MLVEKRIARINGIALDVVVSESPEFSSEVTSYPVEDGGDASEHIHNLPIGVSIEAVVSGTPHGAVADERGDNPIEQVRAALEDLRAARVPFVYEGLRHVYRSMVFESLSFPFGTDTGHALRISASLRRFNVVELVRIAARLRPSPKSGGSPVWLCPSNNPFVGARASASGSIDLDSPALPSTGAASTPRTAPTTAQYKAAGCRQIVRRNGSWAYADTGKALTQAELAEAVKQNTRFNSKALPFFRDDIKKPTAAGNAPLARSTFSPSPEVVQQLSKNPLMSDFLAPSGVGSTGLLR